MFLITRQDLTCCGHGCNPTYTKVKSFLLCGASHKLCPFSSVVLLSLFELNGYHIDIDLYYFDQIGESKVHRRRSCAFKFEGIDSLFILYQYLLCVNYFLLSV